MTELITSKAFQRVLICLAALILLLGAFYLGIMVGMRKARHFSGWSQNYERMFPPRRGGPGMDGQRRYAPPFQPQTFPGGSGAFGKIISASGTALLISGKDGVEQNVVTTPETIIRVGRQNGTLQDLRPDTDVAIFGAPTGTGQIEARLIRVLGPATSTAR